MAVPINVCAANQKIKVNPVYQNSKVIKGKTKKRYRVQAKIGKKKYQTKAVLERAFISRYIEERDIF